MKKRSAILFGLSLIAGLTSSFAKKKQPYSAPTSGSLAVFYAGTWQYRDERSLRDHTLEIGPDLSIQIDNRPVQASVESISPTELVLLDKYGFHLRIRANESRPISLYDEAEDTNYAIMTPNQEA